MSSPTKGLMYDVAPTRVSLVGRPANQREFLVMKTEEGNLDMEKILEVIKSAESEDEASLIEAMKARKSDPEAIDAVVGIKRVLHAFRDVLTEADFTGLAESANFTKAETVETPDESNVTPEPITEDDEVQKRDEVIQTLSDEVTRLTEESRDARLSKMAAEVKIGDQAEILKTLVTVDKANGDVNAILAVLKTASATAELALESEIGSANEGATDTGYEAIQAEARKIAAEEGIDFYEALTRIEKSQPEIVQKYYDEK